jgi:threonine dehydrogenase-like Zn-dependent dehydrogenase
VTHAPRALERIIGERGRAAGFQASGLSAAYLEQFLAHAHRRGVRVVMGTPPSPMEVLAAWERSGRLAEYERFLASLRARWSNVSVLPVDAFSTYPREDFYDHVHLTPRRREEYGLRLAARVRAVLRGEGL